MRLVPVGDLPGYTEPEGPVPPEPPRTEIYWDQMRDWNVNLYVWLAVFFAGWLTD